ncbi:MAG: dehydrogenase, partial [Actinobacteria bacterium]|nr:dehydrogenase [Actinomycetota bacterium]
GQCSEAHLDDLVRLGGTMRIASKCGLGQSSANVFCSLVEHFRDDLLGRVDVTI